MEKIDFYDISKYTTQARGIKDNIILHWSASDYDSVFCDYHINITGDGYIYIDGSLSDVRSHAWHRNTSSIGISISCMAGAIVGVDGNIISRGRYPITPVQMEMLAKVTAKVCVEVGIPVNEIRTHAEVANEDGYGIKSGDPNMRWDLLNLGDEVRYRINWYINKWRV